MKKRTIAGIISGAFILSFLLLSSGMHKARAGTAGESSSHATNHIINLILTSKGSIGNLVWDDDGNGINDPGEPGVSGVRVFVDLNDNGSHDSGEPSAVTDKDGNYEIRNLKAGTYTVRVDLDTSSLEPGDLVITTHPLAVTVEKRKKYEYADFGIQNRSASLDGFVWNDSNADGALSNEDPLNTVIVYADLNNDDVRDSGDPFAVTGTDGYYQIQLIPAGSYNVHVEKGTLPVIYSTSPTTSSNPTSVQFVKHQNTTLNFGFQKQNSSISGVLRDATGNKWAGIILFIDLNGNGIYDPGEPTATTDKNGYYSFGNLLPGTYTILIMAGQVPAEYIIILSPGAITIGEGEQRTANFITQTKLGVMHDLRSPTRVSWGADGNLYVSDRGNGAVFVFDGSLNIQAELKKLTNPLAVNADSSGNIYVGNPGGNNVEVYNSSGDLIRTLGDGTISIPNDIAFDNANNIYVLDSAKNNILVFDQSGTLSSTIGDSGRIGYGISIAVSYNNDAAGEVYIADQKNCTIHVYSLDGAYKKSVGKRGTNMMSTNWDGLFSGLMSVAIDSAGNIHGLDNNLDLVQVFDATGAFIRSDDAFLPENDGRLNLQLDFTIHPTDNKVVMANGATRSIEIIQ